MLQLNPPLPLSTPKGEGFAHILIDYGPESDLYWTVFITETGEIWTFANREVVPLKTSPWDERIPLAWTNLAVVHPSSEKHRSFP